MKKFALKAGKDVLTLVFTLYHCLKDADTPKWAKTVIIGAIGYFIAPIDALPDITPLIGYTDDLGALAGALAAVAAHVKPSHKKKAKEQVEKLISK